MISRWARAPGTPCAAQTGLLTNIPGLTGAAVTDHAECFNYAQGSARVSNPFGPNAAALQAAPFNQVNLGLMAMPVSTQISTHLAKMGGRRCGGGLVADGPGRCDGAGLPRPMRR